MENFWILLEKIPAVIFLCWKFKWLCTFMTRNDYFIHIRLAYLNDFWGFWFDFDHLHKFSFMQYWNFWAAACDRWSHKAFDTHQSYQDGKELIHINKIAARGGWLNTQKGIWNENDDAIWNFNNLQSGELCNTFPRCQERFPSRVSDQNKVICKSELRPLPWLTDWEHAVHHFSNFFKLFKENLLNSSSIKLIQYRWINIKSAWKVA